MKVLPRALSVLVLSAVLPIFDRAATIAATPAEVFPIWPEGRMPGQSRANPAEPERRITDRRRPFYQITNVSQPTVSVFLAPEESRTGGAVLVCPGGGLQRLAYEHEGLEIADWLNPLGISVFVLKYRVPGPSATALLDAQRALGLIRQRASGFKIDAERVAAMGFSAGAEVALLLAVNSTGRGYDLIDAADKLSCRPTSACLVYAGGVARNGELRADIKDKLNPKTTPSMFIAHAFGDASDNSLALALQLKRAQIPSEIHIYQEGGHGFGARDSALPLSGWKESYLAWIRAQGFFDKPHLIAYADQLVASLSSAAPLQALSASGKSVTLADGYAVQRRYIRQRLSGDAIAGYKSIAQSAAFQKATGSDKPLSGVLLRSGRIDAQESSVVSRKDRPSAALEPCIGYIVSNGVDISTRIHTVEHIKGAFEAVVSVVELPIDLTARFNRELSPADLVAANLGCAEFIVGKSRVSPDDFEIAGVNISAARDGAPLPAATFGIAKDDHWNQLIAAVNQIVDQGYALHQGDLVICGSTGGKQLANAGKYEVNFGTLGTVAFEMR